LLQSLEIQVKMSGFCINR